MTAELSELVEEGGDALIELLPIGALRLYSGSMKALLRLYQGSIKAFVELLPIGVLSLF